MGNYHSGHLEALSKEERSEVLALFGERDQYDIIPDFNFENALHSYPRVNPFNLDIDVHQHPQVLGALLKYAENTETFRFNMCLNLLNKASNPHLFKNLLLGCLGSDTSVPDVVFRKSKLSDTELEEMRKNVGKNYLSRSFMSTSAVPQNQFPGILFRINLERGKRKGAIDLRKLDTRFSEQEILLCGYSVFRIDNCFDELIELTYLDYYEFENWQEESDESERERGRAGGMNEKELVARFRVDFGHQFQPGELEKMQSQLSKLEKSSGGGCGFSGGVGSGSILRGEREDLFCAASLF